MYAICPLSSIEYFLIYKESSVRPSVLAIGAETKRDTRKSIMTKVDRRRNTGRTYIFDFLSDVWSELCSYDFRAPLPC